MCRYSDNNGRKCAEADVIHGETSMRKTCVYLVLSIQGGKKIQSIEENIIIKAINDKIWKMCTNTLIFRRKCYVMAYVLKIHGKTYGMCCMVKQCCKSY